MFLKTFAMERAVFCEMKEGCMVSFINKIVRE